MVNVGMRHEVPPVLITNGLNWALLHLPIEDWLIREDAWRRKVVTFLSGPEQRLTRRQLYAVYSEIPNFIYVCKYSVTPLELDHDLRGSGPAPHHAHAAARRRRGPARHARRSSTSSRPPCPTVAASTWSPTAGASSTTSRATRSTG